MNIRTAIARIRKAKPTTPGEFAQAGVPLEKKAIGAGTFREVVKVKDCELVVKFPLAEEDDDYSYGIRHSALEMKKLERLAQFKWMHRFLPKVYYYDCGHGIIVMRFYEETGDEEFAVANRKFVHALLKRCTGVTISDYGECNVGLRGVDLVLIDIGY
jgi:hypothetical protein